LKKKKKKKKPKKKSKGSAVTTTTNGGAVVAVPSKPQFSRLLSGFTDYYITYGQTDPPTRIVADLFPNGNFPLGEIQPHGKTRYPDPMSSYRRKSEEEKR